MGSAALLDQVWNRLAKDSTFLGYLGLTAYTDNTTKLKKIVKEEETDGIVTSDTIPMCLLYIRLGKPDVRTQQVYITKVVVDCFADTGNTAQQMVQTATQLMHNWVPPDGSSYVCRFAYDTSFKTGITGVKGHRVFFDTNQYIG